MARDLSGMKIHPYSKKKQTPPPKYEHRVKYDFLGNIRVIMKWATENHPLTRPEIELLLYLYAQGTFSKQQFFDFYRLLGIYQIKGWKKMIEEGWIIKFREKKGKECALHILTTKGQRLCSRMHRFAARDEEIPVTARANKLASNKDKKINSYYLDAIKKMNKDRV